MAASKTPVKEASPKAAVPAPKPAKDAKGGGASSSRSARQGEKKTTS